MIPLSILDLSVVTTGTKPAAALRNSIDLARHADTLGYVRYWLAEHHNLAVLASPAPRGAPPPPPPDTGRAAGGGEPYPGRLRRRDAAEPRAAGRGRALQDAG